MKNLKQVLTESASYVSGVTGNKNILTKVGFSEIISDPALAGSYISKLTEGFSAEHREVLSGLMGQTIKEAALQESYGTLSPFQALSLPILRVLWPYNSIKDGIQTIVATAPTFMITRKEYFLTKTIGGKKTRLSLPKHSAVIADSPNGELAKADLSGKITNSNGVVSAFIAPTQLLIGGAGGANALDLTTDVQAIGIEFGNFALAIPKHGWDTGKNIVINFVDQQFAAGEVVTGGTADLFLTGRLILIPDLEEGKVQAMLSGSIREVLHGSAAAGVGIALVHATTDDLVVTVQASVTEQWNENNWSLEYHTTNFSVTIPSGKRVSSPLPVELVQDIKNLYDLDAASELGNAMRMLFADAFDIQGVNFFKSTIDAAYPGALDSAIAAGVVADPLNADTSTPIKVFNTQPQIGYMGDLVQWRSNTMKDMIRLVTTTLEKEWYIKFGKVTLFANPITADLLHGVDWVFEQGDASVEEVVADYGMGTFRSAGRAYKLISSHRVQENIVWVLLTPTDADVMTLRYYPYYFGLETGNGYRDPEHSNVPSITFIRRHTFEKNIPAIGALVVRNNAGSPDYAGFNY